MAAATVNIPAIVLSGGPMLDGWWKGERGARHDQMGDERGRVAGEIDYEEYIDSIAAWRLIGHCNTGKNTALP